MKFYLRFLFPALLLVLFFCGKSFSQVSFESEQQLLAEADKKFLAADYAAAMPLFSQLLSLHPKNPNYNYKFGVCALHNEEDKTKALQYFDLAVKEPAADNEAFFYAGKAYHINSRFDEAIAFYEKYKGKLGAATDPLDAAHFIQQCKNGKNLYDKNAQLQPLEKTETLENEFYRNYDLKAMKGRIIPKPLNFKTKKDVKVDDNTLIFVGTENTAIVYSGFNDEGTNLSRELFIVRKLPNGEWGLPLNMGEPVNTAFDEEFAFLHPDGKTLYFSSKGHNTMGGYDIFRSVYDEESGKWSAPVNLAHPVNSPADDIFYAADANGTFAYFATKNFTKPGKVKVYKIGTQGTVTAANLLPVKGIFTVNGERIYTKAEIKITDKTTNTPVGTFNTNKLNGKYLLLLPPGKNYVLDITPENFVSHRIELTVPAKAGNDFFEQKLNFQKDATGETLTLSSWFDATGKTSAAANQRSVLLNEQLAEKAKAENKKVLTPEEFTAYKTQKADEEKQVTAAKSNALAEAESNKQEALLKAEAEKKAAEEKRKAEELAKAKQAEEAQKAATAKAEEEKRKADELAKAIQAEEAQKAAAKAEEEKRKTDELAKAKQAEEAQKAATAKAEEEKRKADELAKAKQAEEAQKATAANNVATQNFVSEEEKRKAEELAKAEEAERERKTYEEIEANRVANINKTISEKEQRLKELKEKQQKELTPEQLAANEKIKKEEEQNRKLVDEQAKKEKELKAQQAKQDSINQQKFLAEKAAVENAQKEKDEQNRKLLEEQKLKEQKAAAEVERKNKTVMDSIALAQKEKEKKFTKWVDSLDVSEAKEAERKAAAELAAKEKQAEEQRLAAEKMKAEMLEAEKKANELATVEKQNAQQEELKREQEKLKANLEEQNRLMKETLRQQERMKAINDSIAKIEQLKAEKAKKADEVSQKEIAEAAAKAEEQRKASELKAAEEKRKKQEEEQKAIAAKQEAEKKLAEEASTVGISEKKAKELAEEEKKRKEAEVAKAKQEQQKAVVNETASATANTENEETPEQRKLRLLLQRMNAEAKGREIVENNMKQNSNAQTTNMQRYNEAVRNKELITYHKKEEKLRPPFDKTDLLAHQGVIYKLEVKLPPVKITEDIALLLKPGTGASDEPVFVSSGAYTTLAEATLDRNDLGYKGFQAAIVAYLNGEEIPVSEAKKQPVLK